MDDIKKDQLKPYVVLGTGSLNKMEKSFDKLAKQNSKFADTFDDIKQDVRDIDLKLPQLTAMKRASEELGKALTSEQAKGLMESIRTNVIKETQDVKMSIMKTFAPLDVELKQTIDLLQSPNVDATDAALERIDDLRKAMGVDFDKVAAAMKVNVNELIASRKFMQENRRKEDELKESTKQQMLEKRDQLREQGINTYLDEKTLTLKTKTLKEEKQLIKTIESDERKLSNLKRDYQYEQKKIQKGEEITTEQQLKLTEKRQEILDLEEKQKKDKEAAGVKPDQQFQGFFSQTFGQAGSILKNTFGEIGMMGKGLVKSFKDLPNIGMNFAKGLGRAALGLIIFAIKAILVVVAIVLFIVAIFKIVSAIKRAIAAVKNFFSFGKKKTEPAEGEGSETSAAPAGGSSAPNPNAAPSSSSSTDASTTNNLNKTTNNIDNKILPANSKVTSEIEQGRSTSIVPAGSLRNRSEVMRGDELNQQSANMVSARGKGSGTTQVIAPTTNNNVNSNSTTQSMSAPPQNLDRSFINLNTVPV